MEQAVPAGSRAEIRRAVSFGCEVVSQRCEVPMRYVATDLSPVGIWLQTADPVRAGELVVVCFEPNDGWIGGELMVFAEVARVSTSRRHINEPGGGMGLEFTDLREHERLMLKAWLNRRRAPVPRRRRPVRRFEAPAPSLPMPAAHASVVAAASSVPMHRPLKICWR